jgi:hypothetical protein
VPRLRLAMTVLLVAALAAAGCSFGDDEPSTAPQPAAGAGAAQDRLDLKGVCPDPIVVQTDWFPETEYGVYYHMIGANPRVDTKRKLVRGPLVVEGQETGVQLEVRSGGPATDFKLVSEQMYTDKSITLGQINTDEAVRFASNQPTLAVAAPMEISPFMIMWDPETYPGFNIIADIGQTNAKVLYFKGDTYMEYLIGSGILRKGQIDDSYDVHLLQRPQGVEQAAELCPGQRHGLPVLPPGAVDPRRRQAEAGPVPGEAGPDRPARPGRLPGQPRQDQRVHHQDD